MRREASAPRHRLDCLGGSDRLSEREDGTSLLLIPCHSPGFGRHLRIVTRTPTGGLVKIPCRVLVLIVDAEEVDG